VEPPPLPLDVLSEVFSVPPLAREPELFEARAPAWFGLTRAMAAGSSPLSETATPLISSSASDSSTATSSYAGTIRPMNP
jgi:hypothetical protein